MAASDKEDVVHGGYWAFEYDHPRNAEVVTQADAFDFDDDWADQFGDDGAFENGGRDEVDGKAVVVEGGERWWKRDMYLHLSMYSFGFFQLLSASFGFFRLLSASFCFLHQMNTTDPRTRKNFEMS